MKWKPLISEDNGKSVSLGRISFWLALSLSIPYWILGWWIAVPVYPASLEFFLTSVLGYNLGKHFAKAWESRSTVQGYKEYTSISEKYENMEK